MGQFMQNLKIRLFCNIPKKLLGSDAFVQISNKLPKILNGFKHPFLLNDSVWYFCLSMFAIQHFIMPMTKIKTYKKPGYSKLSSKNVHA
jgi:hypothetical protein